jgi:hypothetical protein
LEDDAAGPPVRARKAWHVKKSKTCLFFVFELKATTTVPLSSLSVRVRELAGRIYVIVSSYQRDKQAKAKQFEKNERVNT